MLLLAMAGSAEAALPLHACHMHMEHRYRPKPLLGAWGASPGEYLG